MRLALHHLWKKTPRRRGSPTKTLCRRVKMHECVTVTATEQDAIKVLRILLWFGRGFVPLLELLNGVTFQTQAGQRWHLALLGSPPLPIFGGGPFPPVWRRNTGSFPASVFGRGKVNFSGLSVRLTSRTKVILGLLAVPCRCLERRRGQHPC